MSEKAPKTEIDREILIRAKEKGGAATAFAFVRLSGPGWLQSAITLGGGSLAGSLYLGVLAGFSLMWLQPLFMVLGIIMLSAIGYVTLSTGERPFRAINVHVNPVLGWAWAAATLMANIVWCMPQFALANSVMEQNLSPWLYGEQGLGSTGGKMAVSAALLVVTLTVTWCYGSGHWGIKVYEFLLKLMVAGIVISFFIVAYALVSDGQVNLAEVFSGFIPSPASVFQPADKLQALIDQTPSDYQEFWTKRVVDTQQDKVVAAAATAVGINMTFLYPYSLLRKGWNKEFRGLQKFDLATGMFIPFVLATSCIVVASSARFHAQPVPGLVRAAGETEQVSGANPNATQPVTGDESADAVPAEPGPNAKEKKAFYDALKGRLAAEIGQEQVDQIASGEDPFAEMSDTNPEMITGMTPGRQSDLKALLGQQALEDRIHELPEADQVIAATLVDRDANRLAKSLAPLGQNKGGGTSDLLFGVGVVGMTMSTITILMLISGFVICEVFNLPSTGWPFRIACSVAAIGVLGPFIWGGAGFALAVPTSVFGFMLLPIAYLTFFLLMNQKSLLKDEMPTGGRRWAWNILMGIATVIASVASGYMVWKNGGTAGVTVAASLIGLALIVQVYRWISGSKTNSPQSAVDGE